MIYYERKKFDMECQVLDTHGRHAPVQSTPLPCNPLVIP